MQVREIPATFEFVSDSQDVEPINDRFGVAFDSYFVRIHDGDYWAVYGMYGIIPNLTKPVYPVLTYTAY